MSNLTHLELKGRSPDGTFWAKIAEPYPKAMCNMLGKAITKYLVDKQIHHMTHDSNEIPSGDSVRTPAPENEQRIRPRSASPRIIAGAPHTRPQDLQHVGTAARPLRHTP